MGAQACKPSISPYRSGFIETVGDRKLMDRISALLVAVKVLSLVANCKEAYPSAYEHITSEMSVTEEELAEANEILQKEVRKEKLREMAT